MGKSNIRLIGSNNLFIFIRLWLHYALIKSNISAHIKTTRDLYFLLKICRTQILCPPTRKMMPLMFEMTS